MWLFFLYVQGSLMFHWEVEWKKKVFALVVECRRSCWFIWVCSLSYSYPLYSVSSNFWGANEFVVDLLLPCVSYFLFIGCFFFMILWCPAALSSGYFVTISYSYHGYQEFVSEVLLQSMGTSLKTFKNDSLVSLGYHSVFTL